MSKRCGLLVAIAAAFIAGCGSSSSPSAPVDTVAPAAVLDVEAVYVQGAIEVSWAAGSEADLVGYRVYRSVNSSAATLLGVSTSTTYQDAAIQMGASYRYEVTAVDEAGNESAHQSTSLLTVRPARPGGGTVVD